MAELPLTDTEKKQILDHLGWSISTLTQDYPDIYVSPVLDDLAEDAALVIVRRYLLRLNNLYTKLEEAVDNFELVEVAGIKFHTAAEARLWAHYCTWIKKLCACLDISSNPEIYRNRRSRRII